MLVEIFHPNLILNAQPQDHEDMVFTDVFLLLNEAQTAPAVEVVVEGENIMLHQLQVMNEQGKFFLCCLFGEIALINLHPVDIGEGLFDDFWKILCSAEAISPADCF